MKQPNTLPELLLYAADLAEKGCDDFDGKFESKQFAFGVGYPSWKVWTYVGLPNFNDGNEWRIADQDKHLIDDGWISHTGDVCPVHPLTIIKLPEIDGVSDRGFAQYYIWHGDCAVTHYKVIKPYVEPTTFVKAQFVVPDDLTEKEVARIKAFFDTLVVTKESK